MPLGSFRFLPASSLGVDIGTSSLKVVELSRWGSRVNVKNYGSMSAESLYEKPFRTADKNSLLLSSKDLARALRGIIEEAKMTTKRAVFSIPDFSSFFAHFELPVMTSEEISQAVQYEARKYVPLPVSEVTFDWQILNNRKGVRKNDPAKILLVAVPNEVINQYKEIAELAGLKLSAMEAEVFCLIRSSARDEKEAVIVLDMGAQTTTMNVVLEGALRSSRSIEIGGAHLSERISQSFSLDRKKAEELKNTKGLADPQVFQILSPLLDEIVMDMKKIEEEFQKRENKKIVKIVLAGGASLLSGFKEYLHQELSLGVEIANPFASIFYPPQLEGTIKAMGPSWAVALGAGLRGLE